MEDNTNIESKEMCVLLVDDDSSFRWVLARRLSRMGISFVEAENGKKAIEDLEKREYDLLITDIYMPEKDGFDVINAARILYPDIQIILMTASSTLETAVKGLRNRVFDYLTKPIETLAIFDLTVERALRHRLLELSNKELFEKVRLLSITDPLTGLFNRRRLEEVMDVEVVRATEFNRDLSIIMIDVDNLKTINDTFGHNIGDWVLIEAAGVINDICRKSDLPARYGGDEFMILLPETKASDALDLANQIIVNLPDSTDEKPEVEISMGIVEWIPSYNSPSDLIDAVDKVLYKAKHTKGKRIAVGMEKPIKTKTPKK